MVITQLRRSDSSASEKKKLIFTVVRPPSTSRTSRPPSSAITRRRMRSTISRSWVATTTVVPVRLMRSRSCMMPIEVSGSMLPVGSSASRSGGWLTKARATKNALLLAARISCGRLLVLSVSPTRLRYLGHLATDRAVVLADDLERVAYVFVHGLVGRRLEILKDAADVASQERHLAAA